MIKEKPQHLRAAILHFSSKTRKKGADESAPDVKNYMKKVLNF